MTKLGSRKLHICPKVTKMGSIIGHRIDYNEVGALKGQRTYPAKTLTQVPPVGGGGGFYFWPHCKNLQLTSLASTLLKILDRMKWNIKPPPAPGPNALFSRPVPLIWRREGSLPADVLWGSFVTHSFLPNGWMRDERTPKDICGEAREGGRGN